MFYQYYVVPAELGSFRAIDTERNFVEASLLCLQNYVIVQKIEGQETGKKFEVGEDQGGVSTICP
jgi:hypothetical protein